MTTFRKALDRILRGTSDANTRFDEICDVLKNLVFKSGFAETITSLVARELLRS